MASPLTSPATLKQFPSFLQITLPHPRQGPIVSHRGLCHLTPIPGHP